VLGSDIIMLSTATVILLVLGLFQDFGTPREPGDPPISWLEGVAIMIAILKPHVCLLRHLDFMLKLPVSSFLPLENSLCITQMNAFRIRRML